MKTRMQTLDTVSRNAPRRLSKRLGAPGDAPPTSEALEQPGNAMDAGKSTTTWAMTLRALTLALSLPPLLGGCIASYSTRHEEPIRAAPDAAHVCRYNWSFAEPMFRAENVYSYDWAPAHTFGHHVAAAVQALPAGCPDAAVAGRVDAQISAYYLRYANKVVRVAAALPMAYLMGASLGFMPIPTTDHFAVCLEITAQDGLRRSAIAKGQLDMLTNVWGTSNHRYSRGEDEQAQQLDRAMRELTVHAWNKAWQPAQAADEQIASCRDALEAVARPVKPHAAE
jgi:hypothetical protein